MSIALRDAYRVLAQQAEAYQGRAYTLTAAARAHLPADAQADPVKGFNLLVDVANPDYWEKRRVRSSQCGWLEKYTCPVCGTVHGRVISSCNDRLCPWCQQRRAGVLLTRLEKVIGQLPAYRKIHVVATVRHQAGETLEEVYTRLHEALQRMRDRKLWKEAKGALTRIEVKLGNLEEGWHPHAHILVLLPEHFSDIDCRRWVREWLRQWVDLAPGADRAGQYAEEIASQRLSELIKYTVKTDNLLLDGAGEPRPGEETAPFVEEMLRFLVNRRLVRTSGCLYGLHVHDLEKEEKTTDDEAADVPLCANCGTARPVSGGADEKHRPRCIERSKCLPYPSDDARGWYVQASEEQLKAARDLGELRARRRQRAGPGGVVGTARRGCNL